MRNISSEEMVVLCPEMECMHAESTLELHVGFCYAWRCINGKKSVFHAPGPFHSS